jgi:FtsP/CotA-like multicopper oxidase with cupredoxin domain
VGWNRRSFVQAAGLAGLAAALGRAGAQESPALPVPPLLDARAARGPVELVAQAGQSEFLPGRSSATAGYNGAYLGPTLRVHSGDDVRFDVTNRLQEETTVHWHGLLVPSEVDGGPHNAIAPGARWRPTVPVRQPAATAWYHAHPHGRTGAQVYSGLAGMLIVTDAQEQALGLPSRYGVDDLPIVLQDKLFDREQRLVYPLTHMTAMHGMHGNVLLVNGAAQPVAQVPAGPVRLRLLNAGNARLFDIAFDDGRAFHWIASEGGLLREPVALKRLSLAAGQRAEILVDFSDRRPARMLNLVPAQQRTQPVMRFVPQGAPAAAPALPAKLAQWDSKAPAQAVRRRRIVLGSGGMGRGMGGGMGMGGMASHAMHVIDGKPFDMGRIDQRVRLGDVEIWEVGVDGMVMMHPFHIHGVHFEVLRRGGQEPVVEDQGRRDTVIVDEPVELLVHFTQPASERAPFMYHCHILEHEDAGMMGQFTVA